MSIEITNEITYRLIKYSVDFKSFGEIKNMNNYESFTSLRKIYQISKSKVSYYQINPE